MTNEINERLEFSVRLALDAGLHSLSYFRENNFSVELKDDKSPVTRADRETEEILRNRITENCPNDSIIGEEYEDCLLYTSPSPRD